MFKENQKVRVVADTFQPDPHKADIGSTGIIKKIIPATPFEDHMLEVKMLFEVFGIEEFDLPLRYEIELPYGEQVKVVEEDIELVSVKKVELLEDCFVGGFKQGEIFEVRGEAGSEYFVDKDGEERTLAMYKHKAIE